MSDKQTMNQAIESGKLRFGGMTTVVMGITFRKMQDADYEGLMGASPDAFIAETERATLIWEPDARELTEIITDGDGDERTWKLIDDCTI